MSLTASIIADAASMGPKYAARLVGGIPDNRFARMASPAGQQVVANHPAFLIGHLSLYPQKVVELLGASAPNAAAPEEYEALFSKTATCEDDPQGTKYPSASNLMQTFETTYAQAIEAIRGASEAQLAQPNPIDTPMKEVCPTLGSLLNFYLTSHVMIHLGQLSTWRRMEGLPPA